jgi:hypothetical protein
MPQKTIDKTSRFKRFEENLKFFGNQGIGLAAQKEILLKNVAHYFENKEMLPLAMKVGALNCESQFLSNKASVPWIVDLVNTLLTEYRFARKHNPTDFFSFWAEQVDFLSHATNNYGRTAELQHDKTDLEPDLLVRSMFRDIGDLLEGTLQRYLRTRLEIWTYLGWRSPRQKKVSALDFGEVVRALEENARSEGLYKPLPFPLLVSQWRNIANHNSYEYNNEKIICSYGKGENPKKIDITLEDLKGIYVYCNDLIYTHKVAAEIFTADNAVQLSKNPPKFQETDFSIDAAFAYGLVTSGFSLRHVDYESNGNWRLTLVDNKERSAANSKLALQEACYPVFLHRGPLHITACVFSGHEVHSFSFAVLKKSGQEGVDKINAGRPFVK